MPRKRKNTSADSTPRAPGTQISGPIEQVIQSTASIIPLPTLSNNVDSRLMQSSFLMLDDEVERTACKSEVFSAPSSQVSESTSSTTLQVTPTTIAPAQLSKTLSSKKARRKPVVWTLEMTRVMVREVVQQIHAGKCSDNGFKAEVWREICAIVVRMGGGPADMLTGEKFEKKVRYMGTPVEDEWMGMRSNLSSSEGI
ncbi:hypothetical protein HOY82DRAFT_536796 [Tuber indicum]|nr:hypothetical protein HOY82DRAFT_536796 [Tuber indicum]